MFDYSKYLKVAAIKVSFKGGLKGILKSFVIVIVLRKGKIPS